MYSVRDDEGHHSEYLISMAVLQSRHQPSSRLRSQQHTIAENTLCYFGRCHVKTSEVSVSESNIGCMKLSVTIPLHR